MVLKLVCEVILLVLGLGYVSGAINQHDFFPGLRRAPSTKITSNAYDENYLAQILNFIEEQARRRFQQKVVEYQLDPSAAHNRPPQSQEMVEPGFTYQFPEIKQHAPNEPFQFAVGPNDPRFYDTDLELPIRVAEDASLEEHPKEEFPYYRIKGPINVNPKLKQVDPDASNEAVSREMQGLLQKLSHGMPNGGSVLDPNLLARHDVIQKPMDIEAPVGMYVVALVAGVSAAITVGLLAVAIGWYTFYKKAKAAADVDYPAYGVTGPNKDVSPSGDRRLAQSAQMYHYQHQKQQIIAMENSLNGERNGSLSDVNSDDENEEGDYTVYECPGLAPTGEMEVKNPLFFDDPTPATPATAAAKPDKADTKQPKSPKSKE
uniref:Putative neural proliferation differentiation and control protein n=1 Tax=Lutzomyia longipalpis TaxID=7200 RepID=A0A7G3AQY8_LUTLO